MMKKILAPMTEKRQMSASATVEGAIVIPIFVYAVLTVLYVLQVLSIKNDINIAAYNSIRTMSKYYYAYEQLSDTSRSIPITTAYALMLSELGTAYGKEHHIVGGNAGIVLAGSTMPTDSSSTISITFRYVIENPFDMFGWGKIPVHQTVTTNAWLGAERILNKDGSDSKQKQVFITAYGRVYHEREDCAYLDLSIKSVALSQISVLRNQSGGKYDICRICSQSPDVPEVFITDYGDKYHKRSDCSGLKRTVMEVPYSFVENMNQCKKCGQALRQPDKE